MGCGILFPRDYNSDADSDGSHESHDSDGENEDYIELEEYRSSDSEDEERWGRPQVESGTKVQVDIV